MTGTAEVRTAHTSSLTTAEHRAIRELLDEAFDGDFTDEDHEHGLGGMHALIWADLMLIAHGSVVMRRLFHAGRSLRTGYVESVAVRSDQRGRGHGHAVMAALEEIIQGGYEIGALSTSEAAFGFYASRGWQLWTGTASVLSPRGLVRTPEEEGGIYLLPMSARLAAGGDLACDWRDGDVW
ncbi:MAG: GNAT family N-acetyltransferase [Actinomycetota bacterium]|nr:GNAT family N-acetyltransferase [Actinomycetota bacterium]MDQ3734627.1 GNAT family N-acetyltransferase [Actinomycetota bacterium]